MYTLIKLVHEEALPELSMGIHSTCERLRFIRLQCWSKQSRLSPGEIFVTASESTTRSNHFVALLLGRTSSRKTISISRMAGSSNNQRIIPLDEGWNDEIKAKVRKECRFRKELEQPREITLCEVCCTGFAVCMKQG